MNKLLPIIFFLTFSGFTPVKVTTQSSKGINENFAGVAREIRRTALNQGGIIHQNLKISSSAHITGDAVIFGSLKVDGTTTLNSTVTITLPVSGTPALNAIYSNSLPKAWATWDNTGALLDSFNVSSTTDHGSGDWSVNFDRDFANAHYACTVLAEEVDTNSICVAQIFNGVAPWAGGIRIATKSQNGEAHCDSTRTSIICFGTQ